MDDMHADSESDQENPVILETDETQIRLHTPIMLPGQLMPHRSVTMKWLLDTQKQLDYMFSEPPPEPNPPSKRVAQ